MCSYSAIIMPNICVSLFELKSGLAAAASCFQAPAPTSLPGSEALSAAASHAAWPPCHLARQQVQDFTKREGAGVYSRCNWSRSRIPEPGSESETKNVKR